MVATSVLDPVGLYSQNSCKIFGGQKYFYVSMQMPSSKGNTHTHKWIQVLSWKDRTKKRKCHPLFKNT